MQIRQNDPTNIGPVPQPLSEAKANEVSAFFDRLRAEADASEEGSTETASSSQLN